MTWRTESKLNWEDIIKSIQDDDLTTFKTFHLPPANINLPVSHSQKLVPKHGGDILPYYCPDTVLVLSFIILCKAKTIFEHINKNSYPKYDNLYNGQAPIHFLAMVSDRDMIQSAMTTESCQRSLQLDSELKFAGITHKSSVLHIAVTHRNIHMIYAMLTFPFPKIERTVPRPDPNAAPPKQVEIRVVSSNQTTPLDIAVHEQDISTTLLLLGFLSDSNPLSSEERAKLMKKCSVVNDLDAVTRAKMSAVSKILQDDQVPTPSDFYKSYNQDNDYWENAYSQTQVSVQPYDQSIAEVTCHNCPESTDLKVCNQCHFRFCNKCFTKTTHPCV